MAARAELAAAADAVLAYHLAGRQTDDVLLGELAMAWTLGLGLESKSDSGP